MEALKRKVKQWLIYLDSVFAERLFDYHLFNEAVDVAVVQHCVVGERRFLSGSKRSFHGDADIGVFGVVGALARSSCIHTRGVQIARAETASAEGNDRSRVRGGVQNRGLLAAGFRAVGVTGCCGGRDYRDSVSRCDGALDGISSGI